MAHTPSVKKNVRQAIRRQAVNRSRMSRIRTFLRKVETALDDKNGAAAAEALKAAQPELDRGVGKGLLHKNAVARTMSRLNARVKALAAGKPA